MGAGRTNATPNLDDGKFFLGNSSNQSASATFSTSVTGIALPLSGGAMTGAITTNSTFDGRDVATDGTKLDGIEAGATADQTDAEIRAAVEAATDSNVFTDADHSKLNAIEASADVTDTANVTAAGALMDSELTSEASVKALNQGVATTDSPTFAGLNASGDLTLDAAGDIILDADGADFIYKDAGTEKLRITFDGDHTNIDAIDELRLDSKFGYFRLRENGTSVGMFDISNAQDFVIRNLVPDEDILFKGTDGSSVITALTLDMSAAGAATFNAGATFNGTATMGGVEVSDTDDIRIRL